MTRRSRWPKWVYSAGKEPDYRFSFANERTFLAWIRTSLALLAAAVALDVVDLEMTDGAQRSLAGLLAVLGMFSAVVAWGRWASAERAIRRGEALPSIGYAMLLTVGLVLTGLVVVVVVAY